MATYRVWSGASGAANGTSKTDGILTLKAAVENFATSAWDMVLVHKTHLESLSATLTITPVAPIIIVCVDMDNSDALDEMDGTNYYIGAPVTAYEIRLTGAQKVWAYGLAFKLGSGGGNTNLFVGYADGGFYTLEKCKLILSGSQELLSFGSYSSNVNCGAHLKNCTLSFAASNNGIGVYGSVLLEGCTITGAGVPNPLVRAANYGARGIEFNGCDLSTITGALLGDQTNQALRMIVANSKIGTSAPFATQTVTNPGSGELFLYNCSSGDTHYGFAHYNAFGSTVADASIYANDAKTYDGTNRCSWKITSTANAAFGSPYISPWFDKYHSGTSAITPYLECVRDGSATAYKNNEVWAEFSYQGTSGYPLASFASDRMALLGSSADQAASSKTGSDWTGENATAWFGKLDSGSSITPAEIGHLRARVCMAVASSTVYVDPQIRGV